MIERALPPLGLDAAEVARIPAETLPGLLATLAAHQGAVAARFGPSTPATAPPTGGGRG